MGVPLLTKLGISLIILKPIKILQWDLNRSTFVVWEMNRNVSVVRLVVATRSSNPPVSQPACIVAPICLSLRHFAEGTYTIRLLFVSVVYSVSSHSWKMCQYTLEERVFIVRTYWKTETIKLCQQQFWRSLEIDICRASTAFGPCQRNWKPRGLYRTSWQKVVRKCQRKQSKMWRTDHRHLPRTHCANFHRSRDCPEALVNMLWKK
jgi:hypothetical protein